MQHQEIAAPPALQDAIQNFWYLSRDFGDAPSAFEVMPDGYAEIIFYFGRVCSIATSKGLQPLPSPFLTGLLNQPVNFYTQNRLDIIGVRCLPWAVFDLLGLKPGKDGVRAFEHPIAQLQATLAKWVKAGDVKEALDEVQQYFLQARAQVATNSMLFKAGAAMQAANGTMPVNKVAAAAHATVRTLERNFKRSSGYTVKDVSALMRFEQVRDQLWCNPNVNLAGLSAELGYADQSHLGREFKRYSGTTPLAFARKAKHNKQAAGDDFVAFVLSQ